MALAMTAFQASFAGGLLTNTNQSINFLRNPARDGAIGIDGVYYNPAGVAFLNKGFHFSLGWQMVWQKRMVDTTNPAFALGAKNKGMNTKHFEGKAYAPFLPTLQMAYNTGKWSFQLNTAVAGGGGKCAFNNGLGSFEGAIGAIGTTLGHSTQVLQNFGIPGVTGYDMDSYMEGKQYYFGFTLGSAYRINNHLSVYAGLRALYGTAAYKATIENIRVLSGKELYTLPQYIGVVSNAFTQTTNKMISEQVKKGVSVEKAMQQEPIKSILDKGKALAEDGKKYAPYLNGVNIQSDQTGFGIAPILGIDYKIGNFNFATKYEFRTVMSMKNKSTVKKATIAEVKQFEDGTAVREDTPALLTVGAQWNVVPSVTINAGYHHFFDKDSKKYADKQNLLSHGTNEYLGGVEWQPVKKLTVSTGFQVTRYGLTDNFMSDLSFVVNSWSYGLGAKYQVTDKVSVEAAYFKTNYDNYKTAKTDKGVQNDFTRANSVLGLGVNVSL